MEYEYLFTKNLHEALKEKIKGRVFCKVINDILVVNVTTREGLDWGYTLDNFASNLQGGVDRDWLLKEIVGQYKNFVIGRFLYKDGEYTEKKERRENKRYDN